ncbi:class I SAM-dependent methyltransferase [Arthrobacter sp. 35W]|uniref:class I SAM-dependent methyltransferase n=1 Tax=Arthrobacter sp. 35W TaxID=1132441 RepID=UPI00047E18CB|nr:class I SAM-dependent methyltransferase [Arthrobacter sp. 35W]
MTTVETSAGAGGPDGAGAAVEPVERLMGMLNESAVAVLVSIGYQTGLLEAMAPLPPATSAQIAEAAGLDERYVREWLGGMTTGLCVDYDAGAGTYQLRPDYVPLLTGPGVDNLARTLLYITLMGEVAAKIAEKFRTGGGLAYADYPNFMEIQAGDSASVHDASLIEVIMPISGCVDRLKTGIDVADVGCGAGHAINLMAQAFPASRFTGYDFSAEGVAAGRAEAAALGLANAHFEERDVATLDLAGTLDLVTAFDMVHDQAHPATVLANIYAALRPGGTFLMVDVNASSKVEENIDSPLGPFLYAVSTVHCMSVSLGQGGDGLGTVWGVQLAESMVRAAGFGTVDVTVLEEDPVNAYFVATK